MLAPWRHAMEDHLESQAREARRARGRLAGDWYQARADALHYPFVGRAGRCGLDRRLELHCTECGTMTERPVLCGLRHWCRDCIGDRARVEYKRLIPAIDARAAEERAVWHARGLQRNRAPQLRLLTLTVRHGTTLEETRETIARAWPRFRRWLGHTLGAMFGEARKVYYTRDGKKRTRKPHRRAQFCGIWEVADRSHAQGHPHLHVCIVLPWIDVREMAAAWVKATDGAAEAQGLDLRSAKTSGAKRRSVTARDAARYVAGYVTAATFDDELSPEVAAAWVRTTYARRLVQTSRAWWLEDEKRARCDCGSTHPLVPVVVRTTVDEPLRARPPPGKPPPLDPARARVVPNPRRPGETMVIDGVYLPPEDRSYRLPDLRSEVEERLDFVD